MQTISPLPALLDSQEVMRQLQVRSRLGAESLRTAPAAPAPELRGTLQAAGATHHDKTAAVAAPPSEQSLEAVLRRRSSVRTYASQPVPVEVIAAVVERAAAFDRLAWPDHDAGVELEFLVAARNVAGLSTGIHLYSPAGGEFIRLADLPAGEAAGDLVLQLEFADAPAIVMTCGPMAASLDRHGEHGHRLLLTRAGAASQTAWLTALDRGLVGSIFAGFLASALKPLVPADGYRSAQLLAFSCGYPPAADEL
ncbi:nitroreductase family protein [Streptomyces sp. NBC_01363]|uniref:nitroreductase family protein n=1 Tax=Streptomyces sp. NBC_01363 TaxID=2903840 RepID=UPI002253C200|nr:nitroreductase family protein [Streptomyces sp. NBC_01363]MCX4731502.1 nitroreductase family protein [Streptomyces sp. NBC_01363]